MTMTRKRIRAGDVMEIVVGIQIAYIQYIGEHPEYGGTIWVTPRMYNAPAEDITTVMAEDGYYTFYPARTAISRGFVKLVGSASMEGREIPRYLRRAGARGAGGIILTWIVSRGGGEVVKEVLSESEQHLPIGAIWNHEMLVQRISEGWRPENVR